MLWSINATDFVREELRYSDNLKSLIKVITSESVARIKLITAESSSSLIWIFTVACVWKRALIVLCEKFSKYKLVDRSIFVVPHCSLTRKQLSDWEKLTSISKLRMRTEKSIIIKQSELVKVIVLSLKNALCLLMQSLTSWDHSEISTRKSFQSERQKVILQIYIETSEYYWDDVWESDRASFQWRQIQFFLIQ